MATTVRIPYARRRWPWVLAAVAFVLFLLLTILSNVYIDILWYREVGLSTVFWTRLWTQAGLASAFLITFFALLMVNLIVMRRLAPQVVALTPEQEIVERFRENIEPYLRWAIPLGAAALSILVGLVLQGGIRPQALGLRDKVDAQVRAHLSVLLGLILLAKAWGYYLGRFDLLTSERGVVQGASYTDVNAQLPALTFLTIVAAICAVLFFVNARYRVWSLPIIAVGLLLIVSILLGTAYPAFIQQFRVAPNEQQREETYIERNIAGTRRAFGLDQIRLEERPFQSTVTAADIEANEATIDNIR